MGRSKVLSDRFRSTFSLEGHSLMHKTHLQTPGVGERTWENLFLGTRRRLGVPAPFPASVLCRHLEPKFSNLLNGNNVGFKFIMKREKYQLKAMCLAGRCGARL